MGDTAMTIAGPEGDADTTALRAAAEAIADRAAGLTISSQGDLDEANGLGSEVATTTKTVEKRRKFFVQPLNLHVKEINALFKAITAPLGKADADLRKKIIAYRAAEQKKIDDARREAEAAAREEEQKARQKAADAEAARAAGENRRAAALERSAVVAQAKAESTATTAAALLGAGPAKSMDSGGGAKTKTSAVWKFEVITPADVPRAYLVVDERLIRAAVATGDRHITGVRIYQTEQLAFASRR